ncbi:ComEA family DNA-binding protein [Gehongia tenuis]|uniref:ComEA family DNA-binding protein n=1 Tax=Gehongia tenuis TaxID=2763655 RepID=A0A926D472_9FIRM|nr:ComEA family DNA-binding protein [Gehongia tenuis]MBC8531027.1 ComEA family DNA-binding protein [Gehongia tenuis]
MKTSRIVLALLVLAVLAGMAVYGQLLPASLSATEPASSTIQVDVQGAVQHPGLYELPYDARLEDAIEAAGGSNGDTKELNLAERLSDGQKITVPGADGGAASASTEEPSVSSKPASAPSAEPIPPSESSPSASKSPDVEKININTAGKEQLMELPGIGEVKAEAIIAYRESSGGFHAVEELLNVKGIGEKTLEKLKPLVSIE